MPKTRVLPTNNQRLRWLTELEAARLFRELPPHLEAMARFTLATGLKWQQVDMQRRRAWVEAEEAKAGKGIAVPLNADALAVIREQLGKHESSRLKASRYPGRIITHGEKH